ncbi:MAG: hypothetical protein CK429_31875 [Mycobacterium sp.]|nr:MAG: hypothetical protein CK429_31875 [Mycobacterium sp.]
MALPLPSPAVVSTPPLPPVVLRVPPPLPTNDPPIPIVIADATCARLDFTARASGGDSRQGPVRRIGPSVPRGGPRRPVIGTRVGAAPPPRWPAWMSTSP